MWLCTVCVLGKSKTGHCSQPCVIYSPSIDVVVYSHYNLVLLNNTHKCLNHYDVEL